MNPEAIPPVLTQRTTFQWRSFIKYTGEFVAVMAAFSLILFITFRTTRKDMEGDYVFMCEHLFKPLPAEGDRRINLPNAVIEIQLQEEKVQLASISRHGRRLAPIATRFSLLISRAEQLDQNTPKISPIIFGSAEAALGLYSGQRRIAGDGGVKVLNATENLWDGLEMRKKLFDNRDKLAIQLLHLTTNFCGPMTSTPLLSCSSKDRTPGFLQAKTRHSLALTNSSGRELHNCVVAVFFSNAAGESCLNLYFVPDWQAGEERVANYSDIRDFPKDTVNDIDEVDIGFFSKECSIEPFSMKEPYGGWAAR